MGNVKRRPAKMEAFITAHRSAILSRAETAIAAEAPGKPPEAVLGHVPQFLDEIVLALRKNAGQPVFSPLPGRSKTAFDEGADRQRLGYEPYVLAKSFGVICEAVSALGADEGLTFTADEVGVLNRCIDAGLATAIEAYWNESRRATEHDTAERIGFLAHELRNTLSSMTIAYEAIREGRVGPASKTGEVINRSLGRLRALVDHMLTEARLRSGSGPQRERVELQELIDDVLTLAVPRREVTIRAEIERPEDLDVDVRLVSSALSNLVQNALKFSHEGGEVVIRTRSSEREIAIDVEDACGGLPPGDPEELFATFVQRGRDRSGVGLGLAITREAIEAHGGTLTVRDRPDEGCVFTIHLPRES
jgi:signal transduction histidine kinase